MRKSGVLSVLVFLLLAATALSGEAREVSVCSPDGFVRITVSDTPSLRYMVSVDGRTVVGDSEIGVNTDLNFGKPKIGKVSRRAVDTTFFTRNYIKREVRDCFNEAVLDVRGFELIVRAYDDGCAWRFVSKSSVPFKVKSEVWNVRLPEDPDLWVNYSNVKSDSLQDQFGSSHENMYSHFPVSQWDRSRIAITPIAAQSQDVTLMLAEADVIDYPGVYFQAGSSSGTLKALFPPVPESFERLGVGVTKDIIEKVASVRDYVAECPAGFVFPWRIVGIGRSQTRLLESDMVQRLSCQPDDRDWSWVKPGKAAWEWWTACGLEGVGFKPGINTATYKYFIDFAAEYGLEYVIMDGGWSVRDAADLFQVVPEVDLKEIVSYGESKGVGVILWAGFAPFRDRMEEVCRYYSSIGIKGFKVDFHNRDDQAMMKYYRQAAQTCAKYKLLIEFHGCSKPTGLQRTYPNVINLEAVYGLEMTKFEKNVTEDFVTNELVVPFVRMYAGPMDYTPGAMHNKPMSEFMYSYSAPMSQGTRCRQIAEFVAFFGPLQMLCDSPTTYQADPECTSFISGIPVVWDETVALDGKIGEYLAIARRKGDVWYLAAMNGWEPVDKSVKLDFLPAGVYSVEQMSDGASGGSEYVHSASETVSSRDTLNVHLAPGGGYAAIIRPLL